MKQNFTLSLGYCVLTLILSAFTTTTKSQTSLQFSKPQLISGTSGKVGATYKFPNVTSNTDAYVTIEDIAGGATLKNIDDTTTGYYNAWQPTVTSPGSVGSSYIKWDIEFKDKSGNATQISEVDASGIDIDGDGSHIREFTMVNGQSSYSVPTQIPTALTITTEADTDNVKGTDASPTNLKSAGPVANRTGIDTLSQDVRIDYVFLNVSGFKYYTGSIVDKSYSKGSSALDRYNSLYFQKITGTFNVLPIIYQNFNAMADNNIVNLTWQSDADPKNGHFEIEKGFTPNELNSIALIMGAESTTGNMGQFSYTDKSADNASHNTIYYRLKIVDQSGEVSYSQTVAVKLNDNPTISNPVVKVFPNPYMEKVNVSFDSKEAGIAQISLTNASGSIVKKLQQQVATGTNTITMNDLSGQGAGIYFLNVAVNGKIVASNKLMKL
ncbi:MAG TPA: T9SS type A sorting domain-containing protein [Chitinophagaceae bacterium]|nr:T9SS type A sorting domain-containing protein [Chitinophagaceae bacterium]